MQSLHSHHFVNVQHSTDSVACASNTIAFLSVCLPHSAADIVVTCMLGARFLWETFAHLLVEAGMADLLEGMVHFRDRHEGANGFEHILKIKWGLYCAAHILRNVREHKGTKKTPTLEKGFPDNMFWKLQGSETEVEYLANLSEFAALYPRTMQYVLHSFFFIVLQAALLSPCIEYQRACCACVSACRCKLTKTRSSL